jgi:hypothetical protein
LKLDELAARVADEAVAVRRTSIHGFVKALGLTRKKSMARPVCKQLLTIWSDKSASTYPARGRCPGQDGDPRAPVLIKTAAS